MTRSLQIFGNTLLPIHCFGSVQGSSRSEFYKINCATGSSRRSRMRAISASKRHGCKLLRVPSLWTNMDWIRYLERLEECWWYDQQVPNFIQSYPSSGHYWGVGGDHHRGRCVRGPIISCTVFSRNQHKHSRPIPERPPMWFSSSWWSFTRKLSGLDTHCNLQHEVLFCCHYRSPSHLSATIAWLLTVLSWYVCDINYYAS